MLTGVEDLLAVLAAVYGDREVPRTFRLLRAALDARRGGDSKALAASIKTTAKHLAELAGSDDLLAAVFKTSLAAASDPIVWKARRQSLGQMLLAGLAERTFERLYKNTLGSQELLLQDERVGYSETDYLVLNGSRRPVFRLNIKFHGTLFANAKTMVGLEPADCFALATYKIWQGLEKQNKEVFPYVFAIVSVPGLTAEAAGTVLPESFTHLAAFVYSATFDKKRNVEDAIIRHVIEDPQNETVTRAVAEFGARIDTAEWRVISARKADGLLREKLWDRVFAVRRRGFARTQVNMHFSLSGDLTPLPDFLRLWRERGPQGLASMLERGLV